MELAKIFTSVYSTVPPEFRPFIIIGMVIGIWQIGRTKKWWGNGSGEKIIEIDSRLKSVESSLTNHLPSMLGDVKDLVREDIHTNKALVEAVRDMAEQTNRVAAQNNVVLSKLDGVQNTMSELKGSLHK